MPLQQHTDLQEGRPVQAKGVNEQPKSSLLQNMEMGNAAFWANGDCAEAPADGAAGGVGSPAMPMPAAAGGEQAAGEVLPSAAPKQSEC